ncbi:MAG: response regulator transcription factor [Beduini sp.]|uniref:response regulator transcription factor n=1 Tax=Beduini sp. TaxID=1922300 RepID=UPI0039A383DD
MKKILIVEDDDKLANELKIFLDRQGYQAEYLNDLSDPLQSILNSHSDLVLLDINLPHHDGQFLCKEVRKTSDLPIIIITSKNNELDELISMNYGADDFVTKPFNTQILLARIQAVLKRSQPAVNQLNYRDFTLDLSRYTIEREHQELELTKNEFKILYCLLNNQGTIVSREEIMSYLWDSELFVDDNTLTVNINRLRRKLEDIGLKDIITTRRGYGYILE